MKAGRCFRPLPPKPTGYVSGLLVTSNRFRPPAMLAKIATTVDIVSGGRLDFGIGAGSRPNHPLARREYEAHGLPFHDFSHSVESLAEALTVIRRLWTETEPFDFAGAHVHSPERSAVPSRSSDRTRRLSSAVARPLYCVSSPSTPTCGTSPAATSTTPPAAARCWTATAPRSVAIPPPSPGRCSYRSPTTNPTSPAMRSATPSMLASSTSFSAVEPLPGRRRQWVVDEFITTARS